ncbi:hypothetical protein [Methanosarcina acetivorans]|nr:hypothetical protein [Methanosarcina acetivorans]
MIGKFINSIINIVLMIAIFNFALLVLSVFVAGSITGEEVLSASIGRYNDIDESVMFTENEEVTFILSTTAIAQTELLDITIVDPQNKEYFWKKGFGGYEKPGEHSQFFMVFTLKSSGMYQVRISNADFDTKVKLVSGMTRPPDQPFFLTTLILSIVLLFIGAILFGNSKRKVPLIPGLPVYRTVTTGKNRMRRFTGFQALIALSASLCIVYNVAFSGFPLNF